MYNGNVVVHTAYGQFVYILHGKTVFVHTTYRQLVHMLYGQHFMSIQHIYKFPICCMDESFCPYNIWTRCLYFVWTSCLYMSYKTGSLEMTFTTGLLCFFVFERKKFDVDALQNANTLTETKTGTLK